MANHTKKERKEATFNKAIDLFTNHSQFLVVDMNNVKADQLQRMKMAWRANTTILLGKNTVIKKALEHLKAKNNNPFFDDIIELTKLNVAFIFTSADLKEIKQIMINNSRDTYASVGMISQKEVWITKRVTSMGPEKTKFFQALDIFTKITKGKVEITNDVLVLSEGEKVGPSQANLLALLDIKTFTFYMKIVKLVEDGHKYDAWIVDVDEDEIARSLGSVVSEATAMALGCGVTSKHTVPFEIKACYNDILALGCAAGFEMPQLSALMG